MNNKTLEMKYFGALIFIGILLSIINVLYADQCGQATGCVGPYWSNFWLISYSDGYDRRALLGSIIQIFFKNHISYIVINVLSVILSMICLLGVYTIFFRRLILNGVEKIKVAVLFLVLVSGPCTTLFFEVLGDPLQVSFVCVLAYGLLSKKIFSAGAHSVLALLTSIFVVLVHEASVFIFLPAIFLIYCNSLRIPPKYTYIISIMVVLVIINVSFLSDQVDAKGSLGLVLRNSEMVYPSHDVLKPLAKLLKDQLYMYFGTLDHLIAFSAKFFGFALLPSILSLILVHYARARQFFYTFIYLVIMSSPLYVIAHDWGRFSVYSLSLSLFLYGLYGKNLDYEYFKKLKTPIEKILIGTKEVFSNSVVLVMLIPMFYSYNDYRDDGLSPHNLLIDVIAIVTLFLVSKFSGRIVADPHQ